MSNLRKRLELLNWTRICIWKTKTDEIRLMKGNINSTTKDITKSAGLRRTRQLNGVLRWDIWCESNHTEFIRALKNRHTEWICKQFETYNKRRGDSKAPIRRTINNTRNSISVMTWNVQGLNNKMRLVINYIETNSPTIVVLQETRLSKERANIFTRSYDVYSTPEKKGALSARGIAILTKREELLTNRILVKDELADWLMAMEIKEIKGGRKWILVALYLNSDSTIREKHIGALFKELGAIKERYPQEDIIVTGDWNLKGGKLDSLLNTFNHLHLKRSGKWSGQEYTWRRVVEGRIQKKTHIDHFAIPHSSETTTSIDNNIEISDHSPVTLTWKRKKTTSEQSPDKVRKMVHKLVTAKGDQIRHKNQFDVLLEMDDVENIATELEKCCWKAVEEENCVREIDQAKAAPRRLRASKELKKMIKKRAAAVMEWKKEQSEAALAQVTEATLEVKRRMKEEAKIKRENFQNRMTETIITGEDPSEAYRLINQAAGRTRTRIEITEIVDTKTGAIHTSDEGIMNTFVDHYRNLFEDETKGEGIDWESRIAHRYEDELPCINEPIRWPEILHHLRKISRNKSPGPDGVVSEVYLTCTRAKTEEEKQAIEKAPICSLGRAILHIITKCWEREYFPRSWDPAIITSIPKTRGANDPNQFRGISLLQTISKLFTAILANRIQNAAINSGRIAKEQAGFRRGEEAIAQAITVAEVIQRARATSKLAVITFLDAEKAFDKAPHGAIMAKLDAFGVRGKMLNMIKSLYRSPSFKVRIGNTLSDEHPVEKGVKQGETLSPILFLIFINDFADHIRNASEHGLKLARHLEPILTAKFADDIAMIAPDVETAQKQLDAATEWMNLWSMKGNAKKCAVMICGRDKQTRGDLPKFYIQGNEIEVRSEYLYLGVMLNDKMNMEKTASYRLEKATNLKNRSLPFLHSNAVPFLAKYIITRQVIIPTMTYGIELWGWNPKAADQMDKLIAQCLRALLGTTNTAQAQLLRDTLDIESAIIMTGKRSLRLLHKSTYSNTHFQDITTIDDEVLVSWIRSTRRFCNKINMDKYNVSDRNPGKTKKRGRKADLAKWDQNWITFKKAAWKRITHYQERIDSANNKQLETIQRYYEQETYKWNDAFLQALKDIPTLSVGLVTIMRIRLNDWASTKRLSRYKWYPQEWSKKCPFCQCESNETVEHYLIACSAWAEERWEIMRIAEPTNIQVKWISLVTGRRERDLWHAIDPLRDTSHSDSTLDPLRNGQPQKHEEAKEWIRKLARYAQETKWKRWTRILRMKLNPEALEPNLRQTRITEFFFRS